MASSTLGRWPLLGGRRFARAAIPRPGVGHDGAVVARAIGDYLFGLDEQPAAAELAVSRIPDSSFRWVIQWRTDVIVARDGSEQRIATLTNPRHRFEGSFLLDDTDTRTVRQLLHASADGTYELPLAHEAVAAVVEITGGTIYVDPTHCDWITSGRRVYVRGPAGDAYTTTITGASGGTVNVSSSPPVGGRFPAGLTLVFPIEEIRLENGQPIARYPVNASRWSFSGRAAARAIVGTGAPAAVTFDGYRVLDRRPFQERTVEEVADGGVEFLDNGATMTSAASWARAKLRRLGTWRIDSPSDRQWAKDFFAHCRGRYQPFLFPTWRPDLVLHEQPAAGANSIVVADDYLTKWWSSLAHRRLQLEYADGSITRHAVLSAEVDGDANRLHLSWPVANPLPSGGVRTVSFLESCRLDTDEVSIEYGSGWKATVTLPALVVQEIEEPGTPLLVDLTEEALAPSVQSIPTSLAGINALSGRTFTEWYVANMASGSLVGAAGTPLAPSGSPRYARTWPGWNGVDYTSGYRAVEFDGSTAAFTAPSTSLYNLDQSITFVLCVRMLRATGVAQNLLAKKSSFASSAAGFVGYFGATGNFAFEVSNGASQVIANTPATTNELDRITNGAPHWIACKFNLTAGTIQTLAYRAAGTATNLPGGSYTNATAFKLGFCSFLNSALNCQVLAIGVLTGAEAEAFTIDHLNAIDNWNRVPSPTSYVRYNAIAPVVGSDATGVRVQHCAGSLVTTALTHLAHHYAPSCTAPGRVGVLAERGVESVTSFACRNRLLNTDDLANASFTKTNITATANNGEDPAGFTGAARLTAGADNGIVYQNFTGEANRDHTVSVFAKRNQGTDVAARLQLVNSATSAEIAGVDITIGSTWQRFSLTVPAASATVATLRWQLRINTSGDSIHATFAQGEHGWLRAYQPQRGVLIAKDDTEWWIDNADGSKLDIVGGRVEVTCTGLVATVNSTGAFIFSSDAGPSFEDRFFMQRDALASTYPNDSQHYNATGVLVAQMSDWPVVSHTDQHVYAHEWDSRRPVANESVRVVDEIDGLRIRTGAVVPTSGWATASNADRVILGSRHTFSAHLEGVISKVRIWGRQP